MQRLYQALLFSFHGLKAAWLHETAFRQEVVLVTFAVPLALWLEPAPVPRILLIASCLLVLAGELFNSAVESVVDRISLDRHPLSARAKDLSSAAVMVLIVLAIMTWVLILTK